MILDLYKELKKIADSEYDEIVEESAIIFSYSGRARKLRIRLIDNTFIDVWFSLGGEYSFHWEETQARDTIYRHDNAPHKRWSSIKTFPKHCHDSTQTNVVESSLSDKPDEALREFMGIVRKKIIELKHKRSDLQSG